MQGELEASRRAKHSAPHMRRSISRCSGSRQATPTRLIDPVSDCHADRLCTRATAEGVQCGSSVDAVDVVPTGVERTLCRCRDINRTLLRPR